MSVRIGISIGDPTGIGPEIILKALAQLTARAGQDQTRYVVYGATAIFEPLARELGAPLDSPAVRWLDLPELGGAAVTRGQPSPRAGQIQVASLAAAVDGLLGGEVDALCTAPITKAAAKAAGFAFPGHTEYLAQRFGVTDFAMLLAGPDLRVLPLTGHLPLSAVPAAIDCALVARVLVLAARALHTWFDIATPRVRLAALNPHAGEEGMLGHEEARVLAPGLERARAALRACGLTVEFVGPLPADAAFMHLEDCDAVVCCYHDQALIPLKMHCRDRAVNVTLGLPKVRTSPAHGSALDIAAQLCANPDSMIAALTLAARLASHR